MKLVDAETLALELMDKHGLRNVNNDDADFYWTFEFDNAKRRFGLTQYKSRTISLSKHLTEINEIAHVKDTILHEIAHALAGVGNGHNRKWKTRCVAIGANPTRCYDSTEVIQPPHRWTGTCPNGHQTKRMKRMKVACSKCCIEFNHGRFSKDYMFIWEENL